MGPYCDFCGTRCFIPTETDDYIKTDIKATCIEGIKFDMTKTYPSLYDKEGKHIGWVIKVNHNVEGNNYWTLCAELIGTKIMEFEINSWDIEEHINFVSENDYKKNGNRLNSFRKVR